MSPKLAEVTLIYQQDPNLKKTDVNILSKWLKTQPHLPELEELQIILFLHSCRYKIKEAQITIENYFKFRTTSSLCQNLTKEVVKKTLSSFFIGFMSKRTPEGDAVLLLKMFDTRPEMYNCLEYSRVFVAVIALYFHQFGPANGLLVVIDSKGSSLRHLFRLNLSLISQFINFLEEAAYTKIKQIHFINAAPIIQRILSVVRPLMKKSLEEKMKFHSGALGNVFDFIPRECMPEDYCGLLSTSEELGETNVRNFLDHWEFFEWHKTQKIDESKRIKEENTHTFFNKFFFPF